MNMKPNVTHKFNQNDHKLKVSDNIILDTDTYKTTHWMFLEENTELTVAYLESRIGGMFDKMVMFGTQYVMGRDIFKKKVTMKMIKQAKRLLTAHGTKFNEEGWKYLLKEHNGHLPIKVKAVREGSIVPTNNAVIVVESTDPKFNAAWAATYIETCLMRIWYPITIATLDFAMKKIIYKYLDISGDPASTEHRLVDFGSRGVTSEEQAAIGGAAHCIGFQSTDNLKGIAMLMDEYDDGIDPDGDDELIIPAFGIAATEHAVTISRKQENEFEFYKDIVERVLPQTGISSVVIDSYNPFKAIEMFAELDDLIKKNGIIVLRPDSGEPVEMVEQIIKKAMECFGYSINKKGYKVLPDHIRVIQGDGINLKTLEDILENLISKDYSSDNIVFGSGGGLLQSVTRDSMRFALKVCHTVVDGESRDVRKIPSTDMTKASKGGILDLVKDAITGDIRTVNQHDKLEPTEVSILETIYEDGEYYVWEDWSTIRKRLNEQEAEEFKYTV